MRVVVARENVFRTTTVMVLVALMGIGAPSVGINACTSHA